MLYIKKEIKTSAINKFLPLEMALHPIRKLLVILMEFKPLLNGRILPCQ